MTPSEAFDLLGSRRPSDRSQAAQWLAQHPADIDASRLMQALETEPVEAVKRLLRHALRSINERTRAAEAGPEAAAESPASKDTTREILENLAGLIQHETEPAIGWLRRAASTEIKEFEASETNRQIEILRQRLEALSTLATAHQEPVWSPNSLAVLVRDCMPATEVDQQIASQTYAASDIIYTDARLFGIIVGNALRNAFEASEKVDDASVLVETGVSDLQFWISITNRFSGESFDFDHVALSGASTKSSHKGLGLSAMRIAAARIGYQIDLVAHGGTAIFSMRGKRHA